MYVLWQDAAVALGVTSGGLQSAYHGKGEVAGGLEGTNVMLPVGRHPTRIALDDAWNASHPSEFSQAAVSHCKRLRKVTASYLVCCATDLLEPKLNAKITYIHTHTHVRLERQTVRRCSASTQVFILIWTRNMQTHGVGNTQLLNVTVGGTYSYRSAASTRPS